MPADLVFGAQFGDEGKGRVVDALAPKYDIVARYQGGANAGHTIKVDDETCVLHLVPSAILNEGVCCFLGNGMVLDLEALKKEIEFLKGLGRDLTNIKISSQAHVVLPTHKIIEQAYADQIGTTKRGIGAAYADKAHRIGLRIESATQRDLVWDALIAQKAMYAALAKEDLAPHVSKVVELARYLHPYVEYDEYYLAKAHDLGKKILLEGSQGFFLDLDHGTYPYVTSSSIQSGGACAGAGLPASSLEKVIGVSKVYMTRVGEGPFPTEAEGPAEEALRKVGHEYGATTGRDRRCGWLDLRMLRQVEMKSAVTHWVFTKWDVMSAVDTFYVVDEDGWRDFSSASFDPGRPDTYEELLDHLRSRLRAPVWILSYGPERHQYLTLEESTP